MPTSWATLHLAQQQQAFMPYPTWILLLLPGVLARQQIPKPWQQWQPLLQPQDCTNLKGLPLWSTPAATRGQAYSRGSSARMAPRQVILLALYQKPTLEASVG